MNKIYMAKSNNTPCPFCNDSGIQAKGYIEVNESHAEYEVACQICLKGKEMFEPPLIWAYMLVSRAKAEVKP